MYPVRGLIHPNLAVFTLPPGCTGHSRIRRRKKRRNTWRVNLNRSSATLHPRRQPPKKHAKPKTTGIRATRNALRWRYTVDCRWRNRAEFVNGREEIIQFLTRKWNRELEYRLIKELWSFDGSRIAVRFAYESHDDSGQWYRSYGNENWEYNAEGINQHRSPRLTIYPSRSPSVCFAGRSALARRSILDLAIWVCKASSRPA